MEWTHTWLCRLKDLAFSTEHHQNYREPIDLSRPRACITVTGLKYTGRGRPAPLLFLYTIQGMGVVLAYTYITHSTQGKVTFSSQVRVVSARHSSSQVGVSVLLRMLAPPPRRERAGPRFVLALLTRLESRNTTMTVMSSWKWRRTPRSIFLRSEYLISLFLAASCSAALISFLAQPWNIKYRH